MCSPSDVDTDKGGAKKVPRGQEHHSLSRHIFHSADEQIKKKFKDAS
jgi:hypothetical protein